MDSQYEDRAMSRKRLFSIERGLLMVILAMQIVIVCGIFRNEPQEAVEGVLESVDTPRVADVANSETAKSTLPPPALPMSLSHSGIFRDMDSLFIDALANMAQLRSAMHIDEGWDALSASPTMDMRDEDTDYLVSFSIPGTQSSDIEVSLDGRVLTVQALTPVQGPHFTHIQHFERRVLLPGPVGDADDAHASITNGVLTVRIPKGMGVPASPGPFRLF